MASNAGGTDSGTVSVTSFGIGGVNLVKNPLEMADNEMLLAQNTEPYREQGLEGVRKRPGLQRVTGTGAVSPILGSFSIDTLTDLTTPTLYIPYNSTSGLTSPDGGTTWNAISGTTLGDGSLVPNAKYTLNNGVPWEFLTAYSACWCSNARCYAIGGHAPGQILISTGINNWKGITIFPSSVTNDDTMVLSYPYYGWGGDEWVVCVTVAGTIGQITLYQPSTGATLPLPNLTATTPIATGGFGYGWDSLHYYLWIAQGNLISTIRPGLDAAWTDSAPCATGETLLGLMYQGSFILAGTKQSGTTGPRIIRCLPASNGTLSFSGAVSWTSGGGPMYAFGPFVAHRTLYSVVTGGNGATLGGTDAGAADVVSSRHILISIPTVTNPNNPAWRASELVGALDIQDDVRGFNGSTNRVPGPILGLSTYPYGYWYGWVQLGASQVTVAQTLFSGNWDYGSIQQTVSNPVTYPLMLW